LTVKTREAGLFILKPTTQKQLFFGGKNLALIYIFACLCLFNGCTGANRQAKIDAPAREITDDLGRRLKIPEKVERAVSLAPNLTEIVFSVGAGDRLIGVTSFCNYPDEALKIQKIGDTMTPNIENIIALKPQIVFVSTASQIETFTKTLDEQGIVYFVTNPQNLDGIYKSINQIGEVFGKTEKAREVVESLQKRVAEVEAKTEKSPRVKTFVQIDKEALYTIGKESFITDLIRRAGGVSVTADLTSAYPKLSKENAFVLNPEAVILSESPDNGAPNDAFKNSPAVKNGKVFKINADIISRPAPRIVDALEQIARALHPESFQ
jgi:iron complex transport system substrate-binding protein